MDTIAFWLIYLWGTLYAVVGCWFGYNVGHWLGRRQTQEELFRGRRR